MCRGGGGGGGETRNNRAELLAKPRRSTLTFTFCISPYVFISRRLILFIFITHWRGSFTTISAPEIGTFSSHAEAYSQKFRVHHAADARLAPLYGPPFDR
jgi:hypothetical protein